MVFTKAERSAVVPNHNGDIAKGTLRSMSSDGLGVPTATLKGMVVKNYVAIAEPADHGTWWISFLGFPGVTSAADGPEQIAAQAQDALASAVEAGAVLPPAIEDGVIPLYDIGEYSNPLVLLVPYTASASAVAD